MVQYIYPNYLLGLRSVKPRPLLFRERPLILWVHDVHERRLKAKCHKLQTYHGEYKTVVTVNVNRCHLNARSRGQLHQLFRVSPVW